jgi:hypothetical protein
MTIVPKLGVVQGRQPDSPLLLSPVGTLTVQPYFCIPSYVAARRVLLREAKELKANDWSLQTPVFMRLSEGRMSYYKTWPELCARAASAK